MDTPRRCTRRTHHGETPIRRPVAVANSARLQQKHLSQHCDIPVPVDDVTPSTPRADNSARLRTDGVSVVASEPSSSKSLKSHWKTPWPLSLTEDTDEVSASIPRSKTAQPPSGNTCIFNMSSSHNGKLPPFEGNPASPLTSIGFSSPLRCLLNSILGSCSGSHASSALDLQIIDDEAALVGGKPKVLQATTGPLCPNEIGNAAGSGEHLRIWQTSLNRIPFTRTASMAVAVSQVEHNDNILHRRCLLGARPMETGRCGRSVGRSA